MCAATSRFHDLKPMQHPQVITVGPRFKTAMNEHLENLTQCPSLSSILSTADGGCEALEHRHRPRCRWPWVQLRPNWQVGVQCSVFVMSSRHARNYSHDKRRMAVRRYVGVGKRIGKARTPRNDQRSYLQTVESNQAIRWLTFAVSVLVPFNLHIGK
jgi:hypothetical protein